MRVIPSEVQEAHAQGGESGCVILATPDKHSSRGVENPKIYQHPVLMTYFLSLSLRESLFAARRQSKRIILADQQKYLFGFMHEMIQIFEVSIGAVEY